MINVGFALASRSENDFATWCDLNGVSGDDNCVLSAALWTVSGQELFLVVARSECAALRRGTPCRQNCILLLCVLTLSANN